MENMPLEGKKVIRISRKKLAVVVVIILVVGFLFLKNNRYSGPIYTMMGGIESSKSISLPTIPYGSPSSRPDYYGGDSSIKDTREFMKVNYQAEIKTRDVKDVMRDVKSAINDADGRVDNFNETQKYASISFVIPKSELSDFKDEIESLTHEKLYFENSSAQNLLGQKQSIEQQEEYAQNSLADLQKQQKDLTITHTQIVNSLQKQITNTQKDLVSVRAIIFTTTDANTLVALRNQESILVQQETSLKQSLSSENKNYTNNNQNLQNQIDGVNAQIKNIEEQDEDFADNIETVNGYISVNWISFWNMAKIFSPIHPGFIITVLVLLAWYFLSKKNYLPSVELV
jgi:hypothetical protein